MLWVEKKLCAGCGRCVEVCDVQGAISLVEDTAIIDPSKCVSCGRCAEVCPRGAIQDTEKVERSRQIRPMKVHPEVAVLPEDGQLRPRRETAEMPQRVPTASKAHRWMASASTALRAAARLGEPLLSSWIEGTRGGSRRRGRVGGQLGHRRRRRKGLPRG